MSQEEEVQAVTRLVRGAWVTLCLRAALDLGLPDAMDAPYDVATLADRVGADPGALLRLMRAISDADLMVQDPDGRWSLSQRGVLLRSDHPSGLASLVRMQTWGPNILSWQRLAAAVRTGGGVFAEVNGATLWEALSGAPEQEAVFNAAMARRGTSQAAAVIEACDFTDVGLVVDVGGGSGALLAGLMTAHPGLRGVVADRPDVAAEAERRMAAAGLSDRFDGAAADFFASVPADGDAYVLSNILHDWTDEECVQILRVVRAAMPPRARVWVVEKVLDPEPPREPAEQADLHLLDLNMLVLFGARERTSAEYAALFTAAGFDPPVVHSPSAPWNVIEATRR